MEEKKENKVKLCKEYALSIPGFVRFGIIIFHLAACLAALLVPKYLYNDYLIPHFEIVRSTFFGFSFFGFLIAIAIYAFFLSNANSHRLFKELDVVFYIIVLIVDSILAISMFILSIFCFIREAEYHKDKLNNDWYTSWGYFIINEGAFTIAGVFGLICTILYGIDIFIHLKPTLIIFKLIK